MRTQVKYMVIYRHKDKYSISEMCRFFEVSRSGYYDYVKRMDMPAKDLELTEKIGECQDKCGKTSLPTTKPAPRKILCKQTPNQTWPARQA